MRVPTKPQHRIQTGNRGGLCVSSDSRGQLVATGDEEGYIKIWEIDSGKPFQNFNFKAAVWCCAFSNDNELIAGCSSNKSIKVWKMSTQRQHISMSGHTDTINTCAFSYLEKCLLTGGGDWTVKTWDMTKGFCTKTLSATSSVYCMAMLPNESNFVTGHLDGALWFWSLKNEKKIHEIKDYHSDAITSVSISQNGRYMLSYSWDHHLKVLDMISY